MKIDDEVIYQVRRWRVIRIIPQVQSPDTRVPRVPDQLRLMAADGHAVSAGADQVTAAGRRYGDD